ncbi:MAG: hypothetical protein NTU69_07990 [Proteobacteria bacterium]|nr:hypothetical protein [Pseudomonadota bacterium]
MGRKSNLFKTLEKELDGVRRIKGNYFIWRKTSVMFRDPLCIDMFNLMLNNVEDPPDVAELSEELCEKYGLMLKFDKRIEYREKLRERRNPAHYLNNLPTKTGYPDTLSGFLVWRWLKKIWVTTDTEKAPQTALLTGHVSPMATEIDYIGYEPYVDYITLQGIYYNRFRSPLIGYRHKDHQNMLFFKLDISFLNREGSTERYIKDTIWHFVTKYKEGIPDGAGEDLLEILFRDNFIGVGVNLQKVNKKNKQYILNTIWDSVLKQLEGREGKQEVSKEDEAFWWLYFISDKTFLQYLKWYDMYSEGLNETEIARREGQDKDRITKWLNKIHYAIHREELSFRKKMKTVELKSLEELMGKIILDKVITYEKNYTNETSLEKREAIREQERYFLKNADVEMNQKFSGKAFLFDGELAGEKHKSKELGEETSVEDLVDQDVNLWDIIEPLP